MCVCVCVVSLVVIGERELYFSFARPLGLRLSDMLPLLRPRGIDVPFRR